MSRDLISALIYASEKAANIARKCRMDENLLALLVPEHESPAEEPIPKYVKNLKTLADVLIQETIRHDVGKLFPELVENIKGEGSANFVNSAGDAVTIVIGESSAETAEVLEKVLNGNHLAAEIIAEEVHRNVEYVPPEVGKVPSLPEDFDYSKVVVWIDPIDGTQEYIKGQSLTADGGRICLQGLDCVTVLIGAYDIDSGLPMLGIINQPFFKKSSDTETYESNLFWGVRWGDLLANNISLKPEVTNLNNVVVFSTSEDHQVLDIIKKLGCELAFSAGAGHKALKVVTGEADMYILSRPSTFKCDTCAPQAVLRSMRGGIFDLIKSLKAGTPVPVTYNDEDGKVNSGGLMAVRDEDLLKAILEKIK